MMQSPIPGVRVREKSSEEETLYTRWSRFPWDRDRYNEYRKIGSRFLHTAFEQRGVSRPAAGARDNTKANGSKNATLSTWIVLPLAANWNTRKIARSPRIIGAILACRGRLAAVRTSADHRTLGRRGAETLAALIPCIGNVRR